MGFKVVGFKMPQEMSDRIDECVAHLGVQRTAWVRELIAKALAEEGFPLENSLLTPCQGARNDMKTGDGKKKAVAQLAAARASRIVRELMAQGVSAEWAEEYLNARARAEKEFGRKLTPAESRAFRADFLREAAKLREADARAEAIVRAAERADDRPEAAPDSGAA